MSFLGQGEIELKAYVADSLLQHLCDLNIKTKASEQCLSGIICTLGPPSRSPEVIEKMIELGMTTARINLSHGSHEVHAQTIKNIKTACDNYSSKLQRRFHLALAMDLRGPEIRTGYLEGGPSAEIYLRKGDVIKLTADKAYAERGNSVIVYIDYENINKTVKIGDRICIDCGAITMICNANEGISVTCTVEIGGPLGNHKRVNLPGAPIDLPTISKRDEFDLKFAVEQGMDILFASAVRSSKAVDDIQKHLPTDSTIKIIAKIENAQAMECLDEIIEAFDGILIARGDLGIELPIEKVFVAQKTIIARCNKVGKPVICATQMLDSMVKKQNPTRAESSDVANAILDGADCVMLSGETARGEFPLDCVKTVELICREAEAATWHNQRFHDLINKVHPPIDACHATAISAVEAAQKCLAAVIIVLTNTGRSAHLISKYRPNCPIIAVTRNQQTARQCYLYRAIYPLCYETAPMANFIEDNNRRIQFAVEYGKFENFIKMGDPVVVVTGWRPGSGFTSIIRILYLCYSGQKCKRIPEVLVKLYGSRVESLDLSYNELVTLRGLEGFPLLRELVLDNNQLSDSIVLPYLPHLHTLSLNKNNIHDLEEIITKIRHNLPSLTYLSLLGNSACPNQLANMENDEEDYQRYRYYVLHHLPGLKFLDSNRVREFERAEARRRGQFMKIVRPKESDINDDAIDSPTANSFTPLPRSIRNPDDHRASYGKCKYRYNGKHSEGNRFISNSDL